MHHSRYLVAVDPSLTCSGWALFGVRDGRVRAVGKVRSEPPPMPLAERLARLHDTVTGLFEKLALGNSDVLICEAPTTMRDPNAAIKVEQARGIFESAARSRSMSVPGRINPRTVHYEILGATGKQLARTIIKEMAVRTARSLYSTDLKALGFDIEECQLARHQDIIDAILLGHVALTRLEKARLASISVEAVLSGEAAAQRQRRVAGRR